MTNKYIQALEKIANHPFLKPYVSGDCYDIKMLATQALSTPQECDIENCKEKIIMTNCPHISFTDYGVYACKLYNPADKNGIVSFGTCGSNKYCPHKKALILEQQLHSQEKRFTIEEIYSRLLTAKIKAHKKYIQVDYNNFIKCVVEQFEQESE